MPSIVEIIFKTIKQGNGDKETTKGLGDMVKSMAGAIGGYAALGTAAMAAAKYLQESAKAAAESAQVDAKLEAILKATGGAAGMTADELDNLANSLSKTAGIDDELIKSAEGLMLTFRNVAGDTFPRAMQAAIDLQTTFGSLEASTMQLGKALNDPVAGISALARSGVTFSDTQKEQIKNFVATNQLAKAQAVILAEVENQVGGTAAAINAAGDGSANLQVAWGNLSETVGEGLVPATRSWNTWLTEVVESLTDVAAASNDENKKAGERIKLAQEYERITGKDAGKRSMGADFRDWARDYQRWAEYGAAWEKVVGDQTIALQDQAAVVNTLDYEKILGVTEAIANETQRYADKQADLTEKMAENRAEAEALYPWQTEQLGELNTKYAEMQEQYAANAEAHTEANNQILYNLLQTKLAVDGITEAEYAQLVAAGEMFGLYDEHAAKTAMDMNMVSEAVANGTLKVDDMKRALDLLANGEYSFDVAMNILTRGYAGTGAGMSYATGDLQYQQQANTPHATGGSWMVGPGWGNEGYPMGGGHTASPGETITVTPAGQAPQAPMIDYERMGTAVLFALQAAGIGQ